MTMNTSISTPEITTEPATRRPRFVAKLGLLIASLVLAMVCVEIVLRQMPDYKFMYPESDEYYKMRFEERVAQVKRDGAAKRPTESDPNLGWRLRSMLRWSSESTNSRGLRGSREYAYNRTPGVGRVAVLGDSFTYGFGVADDECYPAVLSTLLDGYEVINFGVNGYGTDQQLLYWLQEAKKYKPDVVVLGVYIPNFHRNMNTFRELPKPYFHLVNNSLELHGVPVPSEQQLLTQDFHAADLGWRLPRAVGVFWQRWTKHERASSFNAKTELLQAIISKLKKTCDQIGAKLVIVSIRHHYPKYEDQDRIMGVLDKIANELKIPFLPLPRALDGPTRPADKPRLYADNRHWTAYSHRLAAQRIAAFLRAKVLPNTAPDAN